MPMGYFCVVPRLAGRSRPPIPADGGVSVATPVAGRMSPEVRLGDLEYPATHEEAAEAFADVTVTYADGEENLGDVVQRTGSDRFASVDELESEIYGVLPREAVGEPYQSEGEG